ncbi:MAG: hypothetical protein ACI841_001181 [Planctomycetota bacterium]|jgi:hypothetical protein
MSTEEDKVSQGLEQSAAEPSMFLRIRDHFMAALKRTYRIARSTAVAVHAQWNRARNSELYLRLRQPLRRMARIGALALVIALVGWTAIASSFTRILPGEVGVRQRNWGGERGIERRDFGPGLYFAMPALQTWHRLDARTQLSNWSLEREGEPDHALEIRTKEGNSAQVAVSVAWRIQDGAANEIVSEGAKIVHAKRVGSSVEKVLLEELSQLTSSDFAVPDARMQAGQRALERLSVELTPHHAVPLSVHITGVHFSMTYEKGKQEHQLAKLEQKTQEVITAVQARSLENEAVAAQVENRRQELLRSLKREYDAAARAGVSERQKQAQRNVTLQLEVDQERSDLSATLQSEWERTHFELDVASAELSQQELETLNAEIERTVVALRSELATQLDQELRAGDASRAKLSDQLALATQRTYSARQALESELAVNRLEESRQAQAATKTLLRDAGATAQKRRDEASRVAEAMDAEGELALKRVEIERDNGRAEWLASAGGRLYQARAAARNLRFGRVTLDPARPNVLSPLQLDELQEQLIGNKPN